MANPTAALTAHLEHYIGEPRRVAEAPGDGIGGDDRPPKEHARDQEEAVLRDVEPSVFEGGVIKRAEVGREHHERERDPCDRR